LFLFREICGFLLPAVACATFLRLTIHAGPTLPAEVPPWYLLPISQHSMLVAATLLSSLAWSDCLPFDQARKHVGEVKCITGKVVRVQQGSRGVHFLDFCDDFRICPFTVVIFPSDLKSVGDVRQLQGRMIEIHGPVKEYDGRAEIVLQEYRQLSGPGARIPPLPKNYDVEKKGRYSAGTFSHPKAKRKTSKKQPADIVTQEPQDPEQ
jgi:hypothetical protein